jgi:hypothetical protein
MSIMLNMNEISVPTSVESASTVGNVSCARFVNNTGSEACIYYLNSTAIQLASITLADGESVVIKKRRNFHRFYASKAGVKGVGCLEFG